MLSHFLKVVYQKDISFVQLLDVKVFPSSLQQLRQRPSELAVVLGFLQRHKRHRLVAIYNPESNNGILKKQVLMFDNLSYVRGLSQKTGSREKSSGLSRKRPEQFPAILVALLLLLLFNF
jgi:hypothetical protein